uniref:Uncharacterized protein n=1 Tax=Arundo donax TaxID=35708 RepID=A0A0A8Z693_ARUDO
MAAPFNLITSFLALVSFFSVLDEKTIFATS